MTKRIFIINGHPGTASISRSLVERYAEAATRAGHAVRIAHLPDLHWSEHVVLAAPMWWGVCRPS